MRVGPPARDNTLPRGSNRLSHPDLALSVSSMGCYLSGNLFYLDMIYSDASSRTHRKRRHTLFEIIVLRVSAGYLKVTSKKRDRPHQGFHRVSAVRARIHFGGRHDPKSVIVKTLCSNEVKKTASRTNLAIL